MFWLVLLIIIVVLAVACLLMIRPSSRRKEETLRFARTKFAHRGLHDGTVAENTLDAFCRARDAGYGVELDVHLTADKLVVVFHDDTLERAAGICRDIAGMTYEELAGIPVFGTSAHIPLFSEVLAELGDTPLLVELKTGGNDDELAEKTAALLATYRGPYAIESFNPLILGWFGNHCPQVLRGQLVERTNFPESVSWFERFVLSHMLMNGIVRPDFLAVNVTETDALTLRICRRLYRPVLFGWTVRSEDDAKNAEDIFDTIIFENIRP